MLNATSFYHLQENIKKQLLRPGIDPVKTDFKKVVHRAGEFLGNKISESVAKSNKDFQENLKK